MLFLSCLELCLDFITLLLPCTSVYPDVFVFIVLEVVSIRVLFWYPAVRLLLLVWPHMFCDCQSDLSISHNKDILTFVNIYANQVRNKRMYLVCENCIWVSVSNCIHMIVLP